MINYNLFLQNKLIKSTLSLLIIFLFSVPNFAQQKKAMTFIDLLNVPTLRNPILSPDGNQIVYQLSETNWKKNKQITHLWRIHSNEQNSTKMTNGENGESSAVWSPDGKSIAFIAKRGEDKHNQVFLLRNDGGEALQLTNHKSNVSSIQWTTDSKNIMFLSSNEKSEEELQKEILRDDVLALDENFKQRHLWIINLETQIEAKITEGDFSVLSYNLSNDGSLIVFRKGKTPLYDDTDESEIWVMKSDGSGQTQLTNNTVAENGEEISPDNRKILFLSDSNEKFETYYNDNIFIEDIGSKSTKLLLKNMPHQIVSAHWSVNPNEIYFVANKGVRTELFKVNILTEKYTQLTEGDHTISGWKYYPKINTHIFQERTDKNPGDVWLLKNDSKLTKITSVYNFLQEKYFLPNQKAISWKGEDGETVEGVLSYPLNYDKSKKYALLVNTHGGPASSSKFGFGSWLAYEQVLTANGYFVLRPNYRGSTGYGDDFLRDMVGHYYNQAHLDVMAGVDYLIEQGLVDESHMVKNGWSAGGHMTNKIITFTNRFKAASSGAGAVNWISMYGQSDVRIYRTPWFGGTPWQKDAPIDNYWNNSPLKDIWKVKTPTLVFVGGNDVRVPSPQSTELYRALKTNGVPSHLYIAPREPHGWRELRHRLFKMNVEFEWFEKYAMNRKHVWEKAPNGDIK